MEDSVLREDTAPWVGFITRPCVYTISMGNISTTNEPLTTIALRRLRMRKVRVAIMGCVWYYNYVGLRELRVC